MTCLSDLYYKIGYWFTVVMFAISVITLPFALRTWDSIFSFLMCAGIAFVGAAADYKGVEHDLHYVSAMTSAICSVIWTVNVCPPCLLLPVIGAIIALRDRKRWLLWCEVGCFSMVYTAMILNQQYVNVTT